MVRVRRHQCFGLAAPHPKRSHGRCPLTHATWMEEKNPAVIFALGQRASVSYAQTDALVYADARTGAAWLVHRSISDWTTVQEMLALKHKLAARFQWGITSGYCLYSTCPGQECITDKREQYAFFLLLELYSQACHKCRISAACD